MSDSVRATAREFLLRAVQSAQAEGFLSEVPSQIVNLRFSATWDWQRTAARLAWVQAIRQVLENALSLLGVSAPQEMKRAETTDQAEEP